MSINKQTILTSEGLKKLENELEELKTKTRKDVASKIKTAISFGDLSENSEYDEAKNEQALVEARISQIETMLKDVKIVNSSELSNDVIEIGSKVKLEDISYGDILEYRIVGSMEANPIEGKISDESPVGKSLLGHKVGETVETETPSGIIKYKVLNISR